MALPKQWNGDVALATLNPASSFAELYYPLWLYSGGSIGESSSSTTAYLDKGSTSVYASPIDLFTLNSQWSPNTKFALEVSLQGNMKAQLYDITSGTLVGASVSSSSSAMTVVRSTQFTLTPGHQYGVQWSNTSTPAYITDASLIIFPPAPSYSPYDVANISLSNPSGNTLKEAYIPLYVYSSGVATASNGTGWLQKGSTSLSVSATGSSNKLYTLSSNWNPNQKFALEVSMYCSGSGTVQADLYDITASTYPVTVSTSSTTATLIRSSSFTLTPGHSYALGLFWSGGTSYSVNLSKAHLVALSN